MRKVWFAAALMGSVMLSARGATAGVIAEVRDSIGDVHNLTIPNATSDAPFTVDVFLTTDFRAVSGQMKFQTIGGAGIFKFTQRTFDKAAGWDDGTGSALTFTSPDYVSGSPGGITSQDIGTLALDVINGVPAGTTRLMTINAVVKAGTPAGAYKLRPYNIIVGNTSYRAIPGTAGQDYVVTVLPDPATLLLLAGGGLLLRRRSRR